MNPADHTTSQRYGFASAIVRRLRSAGYQALFAGGCVRDQLLGRIPKDYDVATSASPEQVMNLLGRQRTIPVGAAFGVVMVPGSTAAEGAVEVATFRSDGQYIDGRRPTSVRFCSPIEDAQRRDFTINGMFFDPLENTVLDYVGGQQDLQQQIVRAIGDPLARFHEDKLRLLRAVRFTATFGFRLDPATEQAICSTCHQITQVSVERIAQEMRRMLEHPERALACRLLQQTGLLPAILPELQGLDGSAGSDFTTRLSILQALSVESAEAAWAILLQPLFQPQQADAKRRLSLIHALLRRLKMSNQEIEDIGWLTAHRSALHNLAARPLHDIKPLLHHSCSQLLLAINDAAANAAGTVSDDSNWARRFLSTQTPDQLNPPPLISGYDVAAAGIPPGPKMRLLLQQIRNAQLDEIIGTHATALQFLQQLITTPNP